LTSASIHRKVRAITSTQQEWGMAAQHDHGASEEQQPVAARPARGLVVVTCMDTRIDPLAALGLKPGDAHVLRNAGGVVTEDTLRSLLVSQKLLGTSEVIVMQHTDCGLSKIDERSFRDEVRRETGADLPFALEQFSDVEDSVRRSVERVRACGFLGRTGVVRGFVFDVASRTAAEVGPPTLGARSTEVKGHIVEGARRPLGL
jgi:carbonic anhydrase